MTRTAVAGDDREPKVRIPPEGDLLAALIRERFHLPQVLAGIRIDIPVRPRGVARG